MAKRVRRNLSRRRSTAETEPTCGSSKSSSLGQGEQRRLSKRRVSKGLIKRRLRKRRVKRRSVALGDRGTCGDGENLRRCGNLGDLLLPVFTGDHVPKEVMDNVLRNLPTRDLQNLAITSQLLNAEIQSKYGDQA